MSHKKCAVKGCHLKEGRMFQFPDPLKNEGRFIEWISVSGNEALLITCVEKIKRRTICEAHFEEKYKCGRGLSCHAIPTLLLPDPIYFDPGILNFELNCRKNAEAVGNVNEESVAQNLSKRRDVTYKESRTQTMFDMYEDDKTKEVDTLEDPQELSRAIDETLLHEDINMEYTIASSSKNQQEEDVPDQDENVIMHDNCEIRDTPRPHTDATRNLGNVGERKLKTLRKKKDKKGSRIWVVSRKPCKLKR